MEMTKKEEKKSNLEGLLNSLIEKGWKPFGRKDTEQVDEVVIGKSFYLIEEVFIEFVKYDYKGERNVAIYSCSIRELVSKESGLWQFVCENGMVNAIGSEIEIKNLNEGYGVVRDTDYQYRVLVSALCDEDKLEDFILYNVKID